eukprot:jgi/Galph1/1851/GphlegSOOS_G538.1
MVLSSNRSLNRKFLESPFANIFDKSLDETEYYEKRVYSALSCIPPAKFAVAYGSGAVPQKGNKENNMLDLILVLENAEAWHRENLERNPSHYALLPRLLGSKLTSSVQSCKSGVPILYNTLVPYREGMMKYGCVSLSDFLEDLISWKYFFLAGRLQKPVRMFYASQNLQYVSNPDVNDDIYSERVMEAVVYNLEAALTTAVILLPPKFDEETLFEKISELSYYGDIRRIFSAEDPRKVSNIVSSNLTSFRKLYLNSINSLMKDNLLQYENIGCHQRHSIQFFKQDDDQFSLFKLLQRLPSLFIKRALMSLNDDSRYRMLIKNFDPDEARERISLVGAANCRHAIRTTLRTIVRRSSIGQATKGVFSAGTSVNIWPPHSNDMLV